MREKDRLINKYERERRARLQRYGSEINRLYYEAIDAAALAAEGITLQPGVFDFKKYPSLNRKIDSILGTLGSKVELALYSNVAAEWVASNVNNDTLFTTLYNRPKTTDILTLRNNEAFAAFRDRVDKKGLTLSKRIYNHTEAYKTELEIGLGDGILYGKDHRSMARDLKKYLYEPDKLFRRVKKEGKLQLSKAAQNYHPGQGVYRSSAKNIQRLTRTETNMSYRRADMERYKSSPFVIGFEVKLSKSHPRYDICDQLKGMYPVKFTFVGWHPQCLCFCVPILLSPDEYDAMERDLLNGVDISKKNYTTRPDPKGLQVSEWYKENRDRIANWNTVPYFIKDNPSFFK